MAQGRNANHTPRLIIRISIRTRMLAVFSVLYTVAFTIGLAWVCHSGTRLVVNAIMRAQAGADPALLTGTIQDQINNVAIPLFVVSYFILLAVTYVVSYGIRRPLRALTQFSERVAAGDYTPAHIPQVPFIHDEISTLNEVFASMVSRVYQREAALKQQVEELQIRVDVARREKAVADIVNTDYFDRLKTRAQELRARGSGTDHPPLSEADLRLNNRS
jgi:methyl-accepting chemotaxis protein